MEFYRPTKEKEKQRQQRLAKLLIYGGSFLILTIIAGGVYLVRFSDFFKIKNIEVSGLQISSPDQLVADLKNFFVSDSKISALLGVDNILAWKTDVDSFLKRYPQLESLKISNDYFKKQIFIIVKERDKFGIWCAVGNNADKTANCWWFDENGILFSEAPTIETELLNKVNDFSGRELKVGDKVLPDALIDNLAAIFPILDKAGLNTRTLDLKDLALEEVNTESSVSAPKIYFSLRFNPDGLLPAIKSLKNSGKWKKLEYIDFRSENRAYYK